MDLEFTPEEEAFRQQVRTWLEENLPKDYDPDEYFSTPDVDKKVEIALAWQKTLYKGGWTGLNWPKEYGGRGATVIEQHIFNEELGRARAPMAAINFIGVAMVAPTIIHWGTDEQKKRYLPKILSSEEIWCQGFSEPGAGSDLAALSTQAVRGRRPLYRQRTKDVDESGPIFRPDVLARTDQQGREEAQGPRRPLPWT